MSNSFRPYDPNSTGTSLKSLLNRVIVQSSSDLSGTLDSTKEYFIDGIIDMGSQSIEIPQGGLNLAGYNFDLSKLISSAVGYTMFTSPEGGSGNVLGLDYAIEVTGASSQVYDIVSDTGFEAFEFSRVNYNNCTSLGTIDNYRQGLEIGTGRFGGSPSLTLKGVWAGGYRVTTSIVRALSVGMTEPLFKAGAGFTMGSRFLTDINCDLPALAPLLDFSPSNFLNPSTLQLDGAIITRDGAINADDSNITPNITASDLASSWKGNNGIRNTFEGGSIGVATEAATIITTSGVFETLNAGSWNTQDLQHFDSPTAGQLRHLGNTPREYKLIADFSLDSNANDDLTLRVTKWDNSAASFVTVLDQSRQVNNFSGGRDVAFFSININTELDQNDYIFLEVANINDNNNITAEIDSYFIVEQR